MADMQQPKVNVTLKSTDTSRFKVGPQDAPTAQPPVQITDSGKIAATVADPNSLRETPTGRLKKVSDTNPVATAGATQTAQPLVKTETVQLKVLREKRPEVAPTAPGAVSSSTIRLRPAAAATTSLGSTPVVVTKPAEAGGDDDARRTVRIKPLGAVTIKPTGATADATATVTATAVPPPAEPAPAPATDDATTRVVQARPQAGNATIKLQAPSEAAGDTLKVKQPEEEAAPEAAHARRTLKLQRPGAGGKTMKLPEGEIAAASAGTPPPLAGVQLSAAGAMTAAEETVGVGTVICSALTAIALAVTAVVTGLQLLKQL